MTEYKSGKRPFSTSWRAVPYTHTFTYDGDENLVSKTDADNYTTQYTYNGLDMVTHINYNGGKQVDYAYNAVGDLVRMEDWTGVNTFEYDLLSQLKKVTDHKGNVVKYDYDGNGNQTAITYPDNSVVTYEYDGVNNLTSVTESDGRTTSYQYDGMRRVVRMDYPHGWVEEYEYDSIGQLLNVTDSDPSGKDMKQQKHVYRYDDCGNMVYEYMRGNGTGEATVENDYSYDALHRVIRAEEHYGHEVREYTYDSLGNLTYEESNTNYYVDYILNDLNQIVESSTDGWKTQTTYTYDGRGNLTEKVYGKNKKVTTVAEYVFDETNKLVLGYNALRESSEYTYNGLGALVTNTWVIAKNGYGYHDVDALVNGEELLNPDTLPNTPDLETELPETPDVTDDSTTEPETPDVTDQPAAEPETPDVTDQPATEPGTPDVTDQPAAEPGTPDVTDQPAAEPETPADPDTGIETAAVNNEGKGNDNGNPGKGHDKGNNGNKPAPDPDPSEPDVPETPSETKPGNNGNGNDGNGNNSNNGNGNSAGNNGQGNGNAAGNGDGNGSINKTSTVVKNFVVDYNTETFEPLMEHEVNGLDYKYVYGNDQLSVDISPINNSGKLIENGDHIRLYYHMDYLGSADYLTSPVSGKVEAWTHYNEWGLIVHNAVLKCGQRELDLVKRYATHDYDSVLELYYAKARFYDAHDRRFTAVDPILDPSGYDLREYVQNPVQFVQYLYARDNPLVYIDPNGEEALTLLAILGVAAAAGTGVVSYVSFRNWLNTPESHTILNNSTSISINGKVYSGIGYNNRSWAWDLCWNTTIYVYSVFIQTTAPISDVVTELYAGVAKGAVQPLIVMTTEVYTSYMDKVGCEDDEESGSNQKSGNQKNDQSSSKPNSQGKDQSATNPGDPQKGDGGNGGPPKGTPITPKIRISKKQSVVDHIFREEEGHLSQDTPENRALLESVANDPNNRLGDDIHGNTWYAKTQIDGCQIWVRVRGTIITDGGVNATPRTWNPITGLCKPTQP